MRVRSIRLRLTLLVLAIAAAAIVYGALEIQAISNQPEVREVTGDLEQSLRELRDHIRDNTR